MSIRTVAGALLYDLPRFVRALGRGRWRDMRNRAEKVTADGRGVRCEWEFTSDLHIAHVFPRAGAMLMRAAFAEWPIVLRDDVTAQKPDVSFVIGHRGLARLPHLLMTLKSIAGQRDVSIECVVVEQSMRPEIERELPSWVRYIHTPIPRDDYDYNRAWTLNAGVEAARAPVVILHDNDMLVPARYAAECVARVADGCDFLELKRFTFYLDEETTRRVFESGELPPPVPSTIVQNLQGASIAARRDAYFDIGGFDESFVGWGGEDNEFWERGELGGRAYRFGYIPFLHLWHAPQKGKLQGNDAPAVRRYHELRSVAPAERIRRLRDERSRARAR
ncbi:MAG: hypothetical protein QOI24_2909 [Acidobacteriota bacterium]|jgi:hypothetical protein|nr:hypothetical protein [Acidobacteriota bacterium]